MMNKLLKDQLKEKGAKKALISSCRKYQAFCISLEKLCHKILKNQVKGAYRTYAALCTQVACTCCYFASQKVLRRTGVGCSMEFEVYAAKFTELASVFLDQSKTKRRSLQNVTTKKKG